MNRHSNFATLGCALAGCLGAAIATPCPAADAGARPAAAFNGVRFLPAPDRAAAMMGGRFTGSNASAWKGFVVLAEIQAAPRANDWTELKFENTKPYRWIRYEAPAGSRGNVAEIEFYGDGARLSGGAFGSPGQLPPGGHWKTALDGKRETWFNSSVADAQYVGIDLGERASTARPILTPAPGDFDGPRHVTIQCSTPGATIRYSLDGTIPTGAATTGGSVAPASGILYTGPINIDKTTTLVAAAFSPELAASVDQHGTYQIGKASGPMNSFHVGNSLTANAAKFPMYARTAGRWNRFESFLIGGALTVRLWNAKESTDKERWQTQWRKASLPLDHFTVQPRDFDVDQEVDYTTRFFNLAREQSPQVQPWLYSEWVEMNRQRPTDKGEVASSQMTKLWPALTWEESMSAMLLYNEEVQHRILAHWKEGKRPRIIPVSLAMGRARNLIDGGEAPGIAPGEASFYAALFEDAVHVNANGCYLVDLTWYAAFYGESPEAKALPVATSLSAPQAAFFQRLAWDVVKNYPDCGLYEEGSTPVGKPTFSVAPSPLAETVRVSLMSSTPGAWFRYTLDGTEPTRTRGYVSCGVVSVRPGMIVKAIGYKSGMADSEVATAEYPQRE